MMKSNEETTLTDSIDRKLMGGYYTPSPIADFLSTWLLHNVVPSSRPLILEPSCGDGQLLKSAITKLKQQGFDESQIRRSLRGIEIDDLEAKKSISVIKQMGIKYSNRMIITGDFFEYYNKNKNNLVSHILGNPPFIRYQDFPPYLKERANMALIEDNDFSPTGHTNSWVPFLVLSSNLLKNGGKMAMILPSTLFQVKYAEETRNFLSSFYNKLTFISFDNLVFPDAEQDIVIFLGEKNKGKSHGIRIIELENEMKLTSITPLGISNNFTQYPEKKINKGLQKWTQYYLEESEISLVQKILDNSEIKKSKDVISVDIGVVTGKNKYFIINKRKIEENNIPLDYLKPIVSSTALLTGINYQNSDWINNYGSNEKVNLFNPPHTKFKKYSESVLDYLKYGIRENVQSGYKCRIRNPWFIVTSISVPDAFMTRQIYEYPKILLNSSEATCSDTIHRVNFIENDKKGIVTSFLNSLTFAFAEILGRSYGGGVLSLEPSEAEALPIPYKKDLGLDYLYVEKLMKENKIDKILEYNDKKILQDNFNFNKKETQMLNNIWKKLRNKRNNRRKRK